MRLWNALLGLLCICVMAIASCTKRYSEVTTKEAAIEALNDRDYDTAIALLSSLRRERPDDGELRVLLASAYGGQVGINVVDAYGAFKPILYDSYTPGPSQAKLIDEAPDDLESSSNDEDASPGHASGSPADSIDPDKVEGAIARLIESLADGVAVYFFMPYAEGSARAQLVSALLLLEDIPSTDAYYGRGRALQVLLNVAQFLNYLRDAFPGLQVDQPKDIKFSQLLCSLEPSGLTENLQVAAEYLRSGALAWKEITHIRQLKYNSRVDQLIERSSELQQYLKTKDASALVADVVSSRLRKSFCN